MKSTSLVRWLLATPAGGPLLDLMTTLLYSGTVRRALLPIMERRLRSIPAENRDCDPGWTKIEHQRRLVYIAAACTVHRLLEKRLLSPHVAHVISRLWARAFWDPNMHSAAGRFKKNNGVGPPWLITVGPGKRCNLSCKGCYADASASDIKIAWSMLDRIIADARKLWGIRLVVFSGGEPLMYQSEGKDLLDTAARHPDCLYLLFTNGTLLDARTVSRLAALGNMTVAISVEGLRDKTDSLRGTGTFEAAVHAMSLMRRAGVPFGISVSVTRSNQQEVLSEDFLDYFFEEQGAFYGFFFQYMPIGRSPDFDAVPVPLERLQFWRRAWEMIEKRRLLLFDFWNHGPLVGGCVSAGRPGGYIYIDWNGNVMPCVFAPYSAGNVYKTYASGGTLDDIWKAPFLEAIRGWQRHYGFGQPRPVESGDWLRPCPLRDHHAEFRELVKQFNPEPADESVRLALEDAGCRELLVRYGEELASLTRDIWRREFIGRQ